MTDDAAAAATPTPELPQPLDGPRRRGLPWGAVAAVAVAGSLLAAASLRIPYYSIAPGSALAVEPLVEVVDGPSHDPAGEIYLTTVSLGRTTVLEALKGWLDPAIDVVEERTVVPPDVGRERLREFSLREMTDSKEKALVAAFQQLGYDVIRGTGATVVQVSEGTPADGTLEPGDTIVAVDGEPTKLHSDAVRLLGAHDPGDRVTLRVEPEEGEAKDVAVELGEHPEVDGRAFLGVVLDTRDASFDFPFQVNIASDQIGGPSAGLAFTLEVLDVLTEGELTGGRRVAATGTMEIDGTVGLVGGVAQKTVAVKEQDVDLFLVPKGEEGEARRLAGDDLRIEPVETLEDALRILARFGGNGLALPQPDDAGA